MYWGGTSPSTLFFSTINPLEKNKEVHIKHSGKDTWFDPNYTPLYEREDEFQIFIYKLVSRIPGSSKKMNELVEYLGQNLKILKDRHPELHRRINELDDEYYYNNFAELNVGEAGSPITVLGVPLRQKKKKEVGESDFKIESSKYKGKPPLILTNKFGGKSRKGKILTYFDCPFNDTIKDSIPYYSDLPIDQRVLPGMTGQNIRTFWSVTSWKIP